MRGLLGVLSCRRHGSIKYCRQCFVAGAMLLDNRMSLTDIGSQVDDRDVDARSYHTQGSEASINTASTVPRTIAEHLKAAPFKHQLLDRVYLCGVYFAMVHVLSINFYVGTSSKQLDRLGDTGGSM